MVCISSEIVIPSGNEFLLLRQLSFFLYLISFCSERRLFWLEVVCCSDLACFVLELIGFCLEIGRFCLDMVCSFPSMICFWSGMICVSWFQFGLVFNHSNQSIGRHCRSCHFGPSHFASSHVRSSQSGSSHLCSSPSLSDWSHLCSSQSGTHKHTQHNKNNTPYRADNHQPSVLKPFQLKPVWLTPFWFEPYLPTPCWLLPYVFKALRLKPCGLKPFRFNPSSNLFYGSAGTSILVDEATKWTWCVPRELSVQRGFSISLNVNGNDKC